MKIEDHAQVAEEVAEDGGLEVQAIDHLLGVEPHVHERGLLIGAEQPEKKYDPMTTKSVNIT